MMSDHSPLIKRLFHRLTGGDGAASMRESLEEVLEESEREFPALSAQERVMIRNLLKFGELKVRDVMVPRAAIVAVDENTPLGELVQLFRDAQHSRLPVFRETLDDPLGLVHIKDVLAQLSPSQDGAWRLSDTTLGALRRPILFVPPSMRAVDLLLKMQAAHTHLALVIDEYGGTDGLVSIEDIIEQIVGDIVDEHDEEPVSLKKDGNGYIADARMDLADFKTQTGHELVTSEAEQDIDSLGGLAVSLLGRVPQRGEIIAHPSGYELQILEADPRRVRKLRVKLPEKTAEPE